MTDDVAPPDMPIVEPSVRRSRRRLWIVLGAVTIVFAGAVVAAGFTFRYGFAAQLKNQGGVYGWFPPDNAHVVDKHVADYRGIYVPMRAGQPQSFFVEVTN